LALCSYLEGSCFSLPVFSKLAILTLEDAVIEEFVKRMQYSGYDEVIRGQVVRLALNAYDQMIGKDQQGEEPLYWTREWKKIGRAKERRKKKDEWFKGVGGKNESCYFRPNDTRREIEEKVCRNNKEQWQRS
jgi:hypothetical protein